jgi:hypothetical protein
LPPALSFRSNAMLSAVAALAGRRIDSQDATVPRFPLRNVPLVRAELQRLFARDCVELLVCSAACGADLTALDVACGAGIRCKVVLPFDARRFRETSVVDRPGDWGELFDSLMPSIETAGDLVVVGDEADAERGYLRANEVIVEQACLAARDRRRLAVVVWEGKARDGADTTEHFRRLASQAGMEERPIFTFTPLARRL